MTKEKQKEHFENFVNEMRGILIKKGNDYSNDDKLSNFKQVAEIVGIKPAQVALTLMAIKLSRLGVLLNSEIEPSNESVSDSIIDLSNYSFLLDCIINEK